MKINYLNSEHKSTEVYIRKCPESERMLLFRQWCYEKRMFVGDKELLDKVGRVFANMGYRDRF